MSKKSIERIIFMKHWMQIPYRNEKHKYSVFKKVKKGHEIK